MEGKESRCFVIRLRLSPAAVVTAIGWLAVFAAVSAWRPLMPVDETRYMSVAWEMLVQKNWLLPTLNYEPYSHKPPLLFWLIRAMWEIFGVHVWAARLVVFTAVAGLFCLTARLSRTLLNDHAAGSYGMLALAAMPVFLVYGSTIMFDTLLGVWVVSGMLVLWRLSCAERSLRLWLLLGVLIGLGILTKGPVAMVYMLPAAVLAPVWHRAPSWTRWYAGLALAVATGAALALGWAIPAALTGGPAYAEKIFVTQSAGRMLSAFDHRRPAWFYIPVVLAYLAPFALWPTLWAGARTALQAPGRDKAIRFVMCWLVPAFLFFTIISSKQFHYMTPLMPGCAVLVALILSEAGLQKIRSIAVPVGAMLLPSLVILAFTLMGRPVAGVEPVAANAWLACLHTALSAGIFFVVTRKPQYALHGLSVAAFILAVMAHAHLGPRFLPGYDLRPIAAALRPYEAAGRPVAAAPKYDGEYGFLFGALQPIAPIDHADIGAWLEAHPDGVVIGRYKTADIPQGRHHEIFRQKFRIKNSLVLFEQKK